MSRVAVRVALELLEPVEEARAGVDVAVERRDQRLARPGAGAAPGGVEREVVEQRRHRPGRLRRRGRAARRGATAASRAATGRRGAGCAASRGRRRAVARFELGREGEQRGEGADQRVRVVARAAGARRRDRGCARAARASRRRADAGAPAVLVSPKGSSRLIIHRFTA